MKSYSEENFEKLCKLGLLKAFEERSRSIEVLYRPTEKKEILTTVYFDYDPIVSTNNCTAKNQLCKLC